MKKIKYALLFTLVAALFLATAMAIAREDLARVEIINKTDGPVTLVLIGERDSYALNVEAETTKIFTVEREIYSHTTYSCGDSQTGTVDMTTQIRLVFTRCYGDAPNQGEPSQEKVHIPDSPDGMHWYYK
jgi:hypothetical protein